MEIEINLRPARDDDADDVSQLIVSALRETNAMDHTPEVIAKLERAFSPDAVRHLMSKRKIVVAVSEDRIVGTASLEGDRVRTVFVAPDVQGQGIGTRLMAQVEKIARYDGIPTLFVPSSVTAEKFYAKLGFEAVRESYHGDERTISMKRYLVPT
jgi:N-acetylglutamate synthase-like GNAT family acetyltransferase